MSHSDDPTPIRAVTGTVAGRVQGVGFRASTDWKASRLGLQGWVRNLVDGRVEVFAQGPLGEMDEFEAWIAHGPPAARVTAVHLVAVPPDRSLYRFATR